MDPHRVVQGVPSFLHRFNAVCRPAAQDCDVAEVCDGVHESCPVDEGYSPGTPCEAPNYGPGLCFDNVCQTELQECRQAGANVDGGPYDPCSIQQDLNQGSYCTTLWCAPQSSSNTQCSFFRNSDSVLLVSNGVPCPDENQNFVYQCYQNQCVDPVTLNTQFAWVASDWYQCYDCNALQYRNVSCVFSSNQNVTNPLYCTPSIQPSDHRLCANLDIGCAPPAEFADGNGGTGDNSPSQQIDLFGWIISAKTLLFICLGIGTVFGVTMGLCYHAMTYVSEADEKEFVPLSQIQQDQQLREIRSMHQESERQQAELLKSNPRKVVPLNAGPPAPRARATTKPSGSDDW